jgi:DNA repair exonuclease SbcCD nuclease subunit
MSRIICFTDPHIEESCLEELEQVFSQILRYSKEAPDLVCVGDYYEKKNPTSKEIDFGIRWAIKFKKVFQQFYMITGNHPEIDKKISSVSYLQYLGIEVSEDLVLDNTYYGHFMVKESACGFNESKEGSELASVFQLSILGHQHSYQSISFNSGGTVLHPGSVRYVNFGEVCDKGKYILLVESGYFSQIRLTKVRPMIQVNSIKDLVTVSKNTQVRIVYNDLDSFLMESSELEKTKNEFFKCKVKFNFVEDNTSKPTENLDKKDIIEKWLETIKNEEVKAEIVTEFKAIGIVNDN